MTNSPEKQSRNLFDLTRDAHHTFVWHQKMHIAKNGLINGFIGLIAYVYLESAFYLSAPAKMVILGITVFAALLGFIYRYKKFELKNYAAFYRYASKSIQVPELSYAIDLHESEQKTQLSESALSQLVNQLQGMQIEQKIAEFLKTNEFAHQNRIVRNSVVSSFAIILIPLFLTDNGLKRVLTFWHGFQPPNPFHYVIQPGNTITEQGAKLTIQVQFMGELPQKTYVEYKTDIESDYRIYSLVFVDSVFSTESIQQIEQASYRVIMDGYRSDEYTIQVQTRPRFDSLLVQIKPPAYTQLESQDYAYPINAIEAPIGSEIHIQAYVNKPIALLRVVSSNLIHQDSREIKDVFKASAILKQADTLSFSLLDYNALSNENTYPIQFEPIQDAYPTVNIYQPSTTLSLANPDTVQLSYEISDDYGIRLVQLKWEVKHVFVNQPEKGSKVITPSKKQGFVDYTWDLKSLNLRPQDEMTYWLEVWDNDQINGSKSSKSQTQLIKVPSLTEQFLGEQETESQIDNTFTEVDERMKQMNQQYQDFLQKLAENPSKITENQRNLEDVKSQQEKINSKIDELNKQFDDLKNQLNESNQLSDETKEAYENLQELISEIKDDEFLKALEELQKSMNNFDQRSIQQALQQIKFDEEKYKERINRTMELFKQVKLNADLDRLEKALDQLANKQENLENDSTKTNDEAKAMQDQLQKELENIQKMAEKLSENPPERMQEQVNDLKSEMKQDMEDAGQDMQDASEQLQQNQREKAKSSQKSAKQKMKKMKEMASSFKQQMNQSQESIDKFALENILTQLILLSETQENIGLKTDDLDQKSNGFVQQARSQQLINKVFTQVGDSLYRVSTVNASLSNKVLEKKNEVAKQLDKSITALTERDRQNALILVRQSMGGINDLASMIVSILEQSSNENGGGGGGGMSADDMMEQLQNMQGQQQQLNQQLQEMLNDMQGNRMSQSQMERMEQLSKMQDQIRKQLEELQKNGSFEQGDRVLSDLQRMAEEMEDAINDMRGGRTDRLMLQRQQNILSRMLQAEKAIDERDEDEKRKGETAKEVIQSQPPTMTLEELRKKILLQLQNGELTPYSKDYQNLIDLYFKELERRIN
ncbi:hypothetical protein EP331_04240 [bacterium]|nr:MAG: hypothetical protein EP331_04240 [bacterium]